MQPAIAVGENVTGLLSADQGQAMPNLVEALSAIGHRDICWGVLNARSFGLVQGRRRVFIVSSNSDPHVCIDARCSCRILYQSGNATPASPPPPPKQNPRVASPVSLEGEGFVVVSHATPGLAVYKWENFPTIVTNGRYLFLADKKGQTCRYFTPLEYERLQGFPDHHTEGFSKTMRYRMIGNSVVPAVAEYVARGCKAVLTEDSLAFAA
jgi:site-specific DNA-cytosine methylase